MKVCFLSTVDFTRMTAATIYCDYLKEKNIQYDFIYVDRKGEQGPNPYGGTNSYGYIPKSRIEWNAAIKLIVGYLPFREYAMQIIKRNKYDFIIIWNELTAFIFSDLIRRKFKDRYCINIRDYQNFDNYFIRNRIDKAVKNSFFTTISSFEYKQYFNHENVFLLYGTNIPGIKSEVRGKLKKQGEIINILYIGQIGFLDYVYAVVDQFGNDSRFRLIFAGDGSDVVKEYAIQKGIKNIECFGRFKPNETLEYLKKGDVLYNLYGVDSKHLTMAISLKYYYALYLKMPIMVFENTAMAVMSQKAKIGFILSPDNFDGLADRMYSWYMNQNYDEISSGCDAVIDEIEDIQQFIYQKLDDVLR